MAKVMLITLLILMPMSSLVSKSRETARMAMPVLVFLIIVTRMRTRITVRMGVMMVTIFVLAEPICTCSDRKGMEG